MKWVFHKTVNFFLNIKSFYKNASAKVPDYSSDMHNHLASGSPFCDLSNPNHENHVAKYIIDFDRFPEYEVKLEVTKGQIYLHIDEDSIPIASFLWLNLRH